MTNPPLVVPDALQLLLDLTKAIRKVGVPLQTLVLVHLRVSQLNGRPVRIPVRPKEFEQAGEEDKRLPVVANWREEECFDDIERAALGLAEAVTQLSDPNDPVPDEVWDEAARYYNEQELGALVIHIGLVNLWNRVNIATKQEPVDWRVNPKAWKPMTTRVQSP
ncbi:MAG: carboxymuconolactone decarboxylase family protein [Thermocrispum sp.]